MDPIHIALGNLTNVFASEGRPVHFTDYSHCDECDEHDKLLKSRSLEEISFADVGNVCWDPICFVTDEAFRYLMPALSRLALGRDGEFYLPQYLFHLSANNRVSGFSAPQESAVATFITMLQSSLLQDAEYDGELDEQISIVLERLQRC